MITKCLVLLRIRSEWFSNTYQQGKAFLCDYQLANTHLILYPFEMPLIHASPIQYYIGWVLLSRTLSWPIVQLIIVSPQLIGALANAVLYTLEVVSVNSYRKSIKHKQERVYIKMLVVFNLFVDTVGSFAVCAGVYTVSVVYYSALLCILWYVCSFVWYFGVICSINIPLLIIHNAEC